MLLRIDDVVSGLKNQLKRKKEHLNKTLRLPMRLSVILEINDSFILIFY
jgi:hypothetical protein